MKAGFDAAERGSSRHWIWCGLAGGLLVGLIEATERAVTLRPFLPGALEPYGLWVVITGFGTLAGAGVGLLAALVAGAGRMLRNGWPGGPAAARHAFVGLGFGAAAGGWLLLSLTLTSRFDRILDRGALVVAAAAIAGASIAPVLVAIWQRWLNVPRRWPARISGALLLAAVLLVYTANLLFAPQSSVGVHVVLDTITLFAALFAMALLSAAPRRARLARAWLGLALLLTATHFVMESSPRIASLAKTRGSTSRRAIRATAWLLDVDRDGYSPRWLTGGWDTAPFDPREPEPWGGRPPAEGAPETPSVRATAGARPLAVAPVRRILFITIDALREDVSRSGRTSRLGSLRPPTPGLDSLAARSAVFAAAYAPSAGTEDTFNSLFADAAEPGMLDRTPPHGWLPERLARAGYRIAAFVDDPGFAPAAWGWPRIESRPAGDPAMADAAIDALDAGASRSFVWIHWMPLHASVLSPFSAQSYLAESQRRRYANGLAEADALVARMLARLRARGLAESTLVVLSADHGEELGGHGHYHHNLSLYEPAVRVPLWISGPGVVPGARADAVPQRDLHPTLLEAAGLDAGASPSRSLWPALADPAVRLGEAPIYLFLPQRGFSRKYSWIPPARGQAALVDPSAGRKVIYDLGRERIEAYDLRADPGERVNLAGTRTAWVPRMAAALDSALDVNARPPAGWRPAGRARR